MTAIMSTKTQEQNEAFGAFITEWKGFWSNVTSGLEQLAIRYRACLERGMDMSPEVLEEHGIPRNVSLLVRKIADGKLPPTLATRLMSRGDTVIEVVSAATPEVKRIILAEGVPVARNNGKVEIMPVEKLNAREAYRAIDRVSGRLRSPEEQIAYANPPPPPQPREDKPVTIILRPEEYQKLCEEAQKSKQSPDGYLLMLLIKEEIIKPRAKK